MCVRPNDQVVLYNPASDGAAGADGHDDEEGRPRWLGARLKFHHLSGGQVTGPATADGECRRYQGLWLKQKVAVCCRKLRP